MNNISMTINENDIDNHIDDHVDEEIKTCIKSRKNFFMFAGAGSGKTRSLENALKFILSEEGSPLKLKSKQVAVITFTNSACEEIMRRIGYNPIFAVSTIHSFLWELIKPFQKDIKEWIKSDIESEIIEQKNKLIKAKKPEIYHDKLDKLNKRLDKLKQISRFTYNPNGENIGQNSLNHSEVIYMGSYFISEKETLQKVLTSKFPILFIDESQDTKKELIDALLKIDNKYSGDFIIGMFGDVMQRIYSDGKENLDYNIPSDWERPNKLMNHRSNKRIIHLANAIRSTADNRKQRARADKSDGYVRLFIAHNTLERNTVEDYIYTRMVNITSDEKWKNIDERKTLVLEHSMAAKRIGFATLDNALSKTFSQSFRDGTLAELSFLMNIVYPIVLAKQLKDNFSIMKICRAYSIELNSNIFSTSPDQPQILKSLNKKINELVSLWENEKKPACLDVFLLLAKIKLFDLPKRIEDVIDENAEPNEAIIALREGLKAPFTELIAYWNYVNDMTQFSTHQGIKGLEYDCVAVIMDDENAGGFLFSYEKLFGAKELSKTDKDHEEKGEDNSITRTMRLLYVTCTRAKESLALIVYTNDVDKVMRTAENYKWFSNEEIEIINEKNIQ